MPFELLAGVGAGLAGFLFKAHATAIDGLRQLGEMQIQQQMTADQLAASAAKRSRPLARKLLAFLVLGVFIGGLLLVAFNAQIPVSIVTEAEPRSILWGLIKWGKGLEVIQADGFVLPPWSGWVVSIVVGFFFGTGAAKPARL